MAILYKHNIVQLCLLEVQLKNESNSSWCSGIFKNANVVPWYSLYSKLVPLSAIKIAYKTIKLMQSLCLSWLFHVTCIVQWTVKILFVHNEQLSLKPRAECPKYACTSLTSPIKDKAWLKTGGSWLSSSSSLSQNALWTTSLTRFSKLQ